MKLYAIIDHKENDDITAASKCRYYQYNKFMNQYYIKTSSAATIFAITNIKQCTIQHILVSSM